MSTESAQYAYPPNVVGGASVVSAAILQQQQQQAALPQPALTDEERLQLRTICEKIGENERAMAQVKSRLKQINEENKPLKDSLKKWMIEKQVPSLEHNGVTINVVRKTKKATPKVDDVYKCAETMIGAALAQRVKQEATQVAKERLKNGKASRLELQVVTPKAASTKKVFESDE